MTSDAWRPKIERYLDAELSSGEMRNMAAHLQECAACAAEALQQLQLNHSTKLAAQRYAPSPEFRRRIQEQVVGDRRAGWLWGWKPILAFAVAMVVVFGFWLSFSSRQVRSQQFLTELVDIHVANLAASTPVDVVSSDRHTVKPWFQGRVPFTFSLPDLEGSPFTLVGGRLVYLDHEPGAHLIYDIRSHHISVFILRDDRSFANAFMSQESSREILKFEVESWSTNGLRYFVVGDASRSSIQQLSSILKAAGNN